jgi:hypothetical protein
VPAREIPRQQWPRFLGEFGYRHFGWDVILEQQFRGRGRLMAAERRFLQELATEDAQGRPQITIVLGAPFAAHQTHVVPDPKRVRFIAERDAVEIDTGDGRTVIVQVRRAQTI